MKTPDEKLKEMLDLMALKGEEREKPHNLLAAAALIEMNRRDDIWWKEIGGMFVSTTEKG